MIPKGRGALLCWVILFYDEREHTINRRSHTTTMNIPHHIAPKIIVVALAAGLLALAVILLTPSPSTAEPVISWTPKSVTANFGIKLYTLQTSKSMVLYFMTAALL